MKILTMMAAFFLSASLVLPTVSQGQQNYGLPLTVASSEGASGASREA